MEYFFEDRGGESLGKLDHSQEEKECELPGGIFRIVRDLWMLGNEHHSKIE